MLKHCWKEKQHCSSGWPPINPCNLQQYHIEFHYQIVLCVFRLEAATLLSQDEKARISEQCLTQRTGAPYHDCSLHTNQSEALSVQA